MVENWFGRSGIRRAMLVLLCVLLLAGGLRADALSEKIDALLADTDLRHGLQGVVIKSLKTGQVLYERNADRVFIPASNMKLLVSATVLDRLGPDYTYETRAYAAAQVDSKGVLRGDLVLKGAGDPILETAHLADLARQVKARGIKKIAGNVVVDDTLFDSRRLGWGWSWDNFPYYYSAEISALNLNRNCVQVWVYPGKAAGSPAVVRIEPPTGYVTVENTATTGAAGAEKKIWIDRVMGTNTIRVGGVIPAGTKVSSLEEPITVKEPALYAGSVFRDQLSRLGVLVLGEVKSGKLPVKAEQVAVHKSVPLSKIVWMLNKPSDNLIAEVLLKTLGAVVKGTGSSEAGAEVETEFFGKIGMDLSALNIVDGSGLSRLNYVSPRNLSTLLSHMYSHAHHQAYLESLPIAGVDGTLRSRMKDTPAERNVRAKTGYVSRVSSLSGYVNTKSGEPLVFSILMNHHLCANSQATGVQNAICALLAELP